MTITATAKAKFYVGSPSNTISLLSDFQADTYTEIKEIEDLGNWGPEAKEIAVRHIDDAYVRRLAGTVDGGVITLAASFDALDPGQAFLRANIGSKFSFKSTLNDAPNANGTPTTFFFRGVILGAQTKFGKADDVTMTEFKIGVDGEIFEVLADYSITVTPAAGALPAATHATPYSETITATGGDGAVTYALAAGSSLPGGLTLNPATGVISGTPSAAGNFTFSIVANFSGGAGGTQTTAYTLAVS
ncbi:Ig domain-containing protein [Methylocystis heyeri]|uniref:Uncharacterized protein n=1 Tax=Methylocystis heyeri TaxID=391905 RepID=A0A6B8KDY4_9HYPH|nr:Ig domain-containing protein [Methylocystis heyeri]QGM46654.1 hypothetical protein H2LOC_013660 [Methylocystis heyeri]